MFQSLKIIYLFSGRIVDMESLKTEMPLKVNKPKKERSEKQKAKKLVNTLSQAQEVPFVTRNDFDSFKNDILSQLKPSNKEPTIVEKIVEKPVEKTIVRESVRVVSGNELLDRIFFGSK